MKIIHVITSLNSGGAETMLYKLLKNKSGIYDVEIVTLLSGGFYSREIKEMNIPIHEINIKGEKNLVKVISKLISVLKKADIIQSWMYHSDLIAFIFGKLFLRKKVIWGIRRSYLNKEHMQSSTLWVAKMCALVSKKVDGIISCTITGKRNHEQLGYANRNFVVIPNGFEIENFHDTILVAPPSNKKLNLLNVARWEPLKDHQTLFAAAQILKDKNIQFELRLVGSGIDNNNNSLMGLITEFNLEKEVKLLGVRNDIPKIMSSSDIYISSSLSEGFPNVLGEAMASGLYCVATDAGDTKFILNGFGTVVPTKDPEKLAEAILNVKMMNEADLYLRKFRARKRVEEEFSIKAIVLQYEKMYEKIINE